MHMTISINESKVIADIFGNDKTLGFVVDYSLLAIFNFNFFLNLTVFLRVPPHKRGYPLGGKGGTPKIFQVKIKIQSKNKIIQK